MELKKILKFILITIGIVLILISLVEFYNIFIEFTKNNYKDVRLFFQALLIITIGVIILDVGVNLNEPFKKLAKVLISLAVFFLTFAIFFYPLNQHANDFANSLQPTIDMLTASEIPNLANKLPQPSVDSIKVSFSKNEKIYSYYNKNLTVAQSYNFLNQIGLNSIVKDNTTNNLEKAAFAKVIITQIYQNLTNKNIVLPTSVLKKKIGELLKNNPKIAQNLAMIELTFPIKNNAYLKLSVSNGTIVKTIYLNNLSKEDINLLWKSLNFSQKVSFETREYIIKIILYGLTNQYPQTKKIVIPINIVKGFIPNSIKELTSFDLFNKNISKRAEEINRLRIFCEIKINNNSENNKFIKDICSKIELTKYSNLINLLSNNSDNLTKELNLPKIDYLSKYNSIPKVREKIKDTGSSWLIFFLLSILFFIAGFSSYLYHTKKKYEEADYLETSYYTSKYNFTNAIFGFILLILLKILISKDTIKKILEQINTINSNIINLFLNLPLYNVSLKTFYELYFIYVIYISVSITIFIALFILYKKDKNDEKTKKSKDKTNENNNNNNYENGDEWKNSNNKPKNNYKTKEEWKNEEKENQVLKEMSEDIED